MTVAAAHPLAQLLPIPAGAGDPPAFAARPGVAGELLGGGHAVALAWCGQQPGHVAWVGRRAWPAAEALRRAGLLGRSLLVDADSPRDRLWAAELCVRAGGGSGPVDAVVVDAAGFDLTATRRLQLAARARDARLILLRPEADRRAASAAGERWLVTPAPATAQGDEVGPRRPEWDVRLLRLKGPRPTLPDRLPIGLFHGDEGDDDDDASSPCLLRWRVRWDPDAGLCRPADEPRRHDAWPRRAIPFAAGVRLPLGLPADVAGRPAGAAVAAVG